MVLFYVPLNYKQYLKLKSAVLHKSSFYLVILGLDLRIRSFQRYKTFSNAVAGDIITHEHELKHYLKRLNFLLVSLPLCNESGPQKGTNKKQDNDYRNNNSWDESLPILAGSHSAGRLYLYLFHHVRSQSDLKQKNSVSVSTTSIIKYKYK